MTDKDILYQMISREVDNLLGMYVPGLRVFSGTITKYIVNFIDPYVNAFFGEDTGINTEAAGEFVKSEVNEKVQDFMKKFEAEKKLKNGM